MPTCFCRGRLVSQLRLPALSPFLSPTTWGTVAGCQNASAAAASSPSFVFLLASHRLGYLIAKVFLPLPPCLPALSPSFGSLLVPLLAPAGSGVLDLQTYLYFCFSFCVSFVFLSVSHLDFGLVVLVVLAPTSVLILNARGRLISTELWNRACFLNSH